MTGRRRSWTSGLALSLLLVVVGVIIDSPQVRAADGTEIVIPTEMRLESGVQVQLAALDYSLAGFRGNWSNPVLQSANERYQFSLQLADVGDTHFCWVAVVDKVNRRKMLRWRAPCDKRVEVEKCNLIATAGGDIQFLTGTGSLAWHTNTSGMGIQILQLDDTGNFMLKSGDGTLVWQSDDSAAPPLCLIPGPLQTDDSLSSPIIAPAPPPALSRQTMGGRSTAGAAVSMIISCIIPLLASCLPLL